MNRTANLLVIRRDQTLININWFQVRRGLDNLYRKMEKTLCEEENLMQVRSFLSHYIARSFLAILARNSKSHTAA